MEQTSEGQFAEVVLVEPDLKGLLSAATKERFSEELQRRVEARKRESAQGLAGLQPGARSSLQSGDTTTRRNQFQFINFSSFRARKHLSFFASKALSLALWTSVPASTQSRADNFLALVVS